MTRTYTLVMPRYVIPPSSGIIWKLLTRVLQSGRIENNRPYRHPSIVAIMKEQFFTGPSSMGIRHRSAFKAPPSDSASDSQVEIPLSMLALAATAVRSYSFQFTTNLHLGPRTMLRLWNS